MSTINSEDKGTKGMATNTKETQAWLREAGDTCWDRGVGDQMSDRVDGSRVAIVSRPGNIREGRLGEDVREMFAEDRDGQEVGGELLVVSPKATRVDCYPE